MSDPEVVNLIEQNFVPLLIINNTGGKDARMLKRFKEPSWNYQVIRFFDHEGKDIIPRKDRVWDKASLLKRMNLTLSKTGKTLKK